MFGANTNSGDLSKIRHSSVGKPGSQTGDQFSFLSTPPVWLCMRIWQMHWPWNYKKWDEMGTYNNYPNESASITFLKMYRRTVSWYNFSFDETGLG